MSIAAIITDLIAAGTPAELVGRVAEALAAREVVTVQVRDEAAERRRAADRERKANVRGIPQTSAEYVDSEVLVSPAPLPVFSKSSEPSQKDPKGSQKGSRQTSDADFDAFWSAYPRREGSDPKQPALKYFRQAVRGGTDPQTIIIAAQHFRSSQLGKDARFIPQARTWLKEARWEDSAPRLAVVPTATSPPRQRLTPEEVEAQVRAFGIIK